MERDPVQLVWRHDRAGHLLASVLGLLAIPVMLVVIDLPRRAVDAIVLGRTTFIDLALPGAYADEPIVLSTGRFLPPLAYLVALALTILAAILLRGLILAAIDLWRARRAASLAADIAGRAMAGLAHARSVDGLEPLALSRETTRAACQVEPFLAGALTVPALAIVRLLVGVTYAAWLDWRLGLAAGMTAIIIAAASSWGSAAKARTARRHARDTARLVTIHETLARQYAAMRAHGTAQEELRRIGSAERALRTGPPPAAAMARFIGTALTDGTVLIAPLAAIALQVMMGASPGHVVGAAIAFALLPGPLARLTQWREERAAAATQLSLIADAMRSLRARVGTEGAKSAALPDGDVVVQIEDLRAVDDSGQVFGPLSLTLAPGTHAALLGRPGDLSPILEAVAGLRAPQSGRVDLSGLDPYRLPAGSRAGLIAFAPTEPVLVDGTLERNVTYGQSEAVRAATSMAELSAALDTAGLKAHVRAQAEAAPVDPQRHPDLAAAIPGARRAVREALELEKLQHLVDPFEQGRYNSHATLAENILFGEPVGDTFGEENLARHPFLRAILDAEDLTNDLIAMGLSIARSTVEMFAGIPEGHALFDRFAFMGAEEREDFEDIVARQGARRRGLDAARDRERLISLALRYVEPRHRLGLLDEALTERLLRARKTFAELLPVSLRPAVDFYRADAVCKAASLADNLLFGRVAYDVAGAQDAVSAILDRVIAEAGLTDAVLRLGLSVPIDASLRADRAFAMSVELARVLLRRAPVVVAADPTAGLGELEAGRRLSALRSALAGRTLIIGLPAGETEAEGFEPGIPVSRAIRTRS